MATPFQVISRSSQMGLDLVGTVVSGLGITAEESGAGALRQTVFTFNNFVVTMTDDGSTGHAAVKIYDFQPGCIWPCGGVGDLSVTASSGSLAGVSVGLGSTADAGSGIATTEENFVVESGTVTATAATALEWKQATIPTTALDGTGTPIDLYFNVNSTGDPGTGQTLTFNGKIVVTWVNLGDIT